MENWSRRKFLGAMGVVGAGLLFRDFLKVQSAAAYSPVEIIGEGELEQLTQFELIFPEVRNALERAESLSFTNTRFGRYAVIPNLFSYDFNEIDGNSNPEGSYCAPFATGNFMATTGQDTSTIISGFENGIAEARLTGEWAEQGIDLTSDWIAHHSRGIKRHQSFDFSMPFIYQDRQIELPYTGVKEDPSLSIIRSMKNSAGEELSMLGISVTGGNGKTGHLADVFVNRDRIITLDLSPSGTCLSVFESVSDLAGALEAYTGTLNRRGAEIFVRVA